MNLRSALSIALLLGALPAAGQPLTEPARFGNDRPTPSTPLERAIFLAQYDDDQVDVYFSSFQPTYEAVMLFDGVGGADVTLGSVDICWRQDGSDPKIRYEVVIYADDGPGGAPGTELHNFAAIAESVGNGPSFHSTFLGISLTQSDVYIGVRYNPAVDPDAWLCMDNDGFDGSSVQPGFVRSNETGSWATYQAAFGDPDYNAMMFRADFATPGVFIERLLIPSFEVDTTDPDGNTSLLAVRNLRDSGTTVTIEYFTETGSLFHQEDVFLAGRDTQTVNLRFVPGLTAGGDGFARGYVQMIAAGLPDEQVLAGDYFQIDQTGNFATGDEAVRQTCQESSVRFLDFGSGADFSIWIENPQGDNPSFDPPSFVVRVLDEDGNLLQTVEFFASRHLVSVSASDLTASNFGTLLFDFGNAGGGTVFAEYSAFGRFSVGVGSQCEDF